MDLALPHGWGTDRRDVDRRFPGDDHGPRPAEEWYRAVTVDAPVETVFRWLCQLKVAPYSYDLLDNRGRQSPRELTPGAENLAIGQEVMTIFTLADYRWNESMVLRMTDQRALALCGLFIVTYVVEPVGDDRTRLIVKLAVGNIDDQTVRSRLRRRFLAWGDLMMMRKQLLVFKELAEKDPLRTGQRSLIDRCRRFEHCVRE
ncbi:hypothetical protein [Haloglycomyces albus]|uniref:hypothetical protein n=1 Tax=Haloglycomyces albus TaxID=526067 RepID=UPI00046D2337|nr:hypothetical protein [Haloglycomyces albus]